ncbi:MAG TPA: T9SS type A sorting domain-containing protein [Candidatus Eisenbacteria bacterium]
MRAHLFLAAIAVLLPAAAPAQQLLRTAFSGGAPEGTDGTIQLRATVGEAGVVGRVADASFTLGEGFWSGFHRIVATDVPGAAAGGISWANGLQSGFPNPFRHRTTIAYTVGAPSPVRLAVFDVAGRRVSTLADGPHAPGPYRVDWDGRDRAGLRSASGVYFYRLEIGSWSDTKKILKLR